MATVKSKCNTKTEGAYEGRSLVDRLLMYYAKFEGNRTKAVKYAQKLLDLGHIEGINESKIFQDNNEKYRWTDVASVVNSKARSRSCQLSPGVDAVKQSLKEDRPKRTVRISIETDNCEEAEIRAHIRTQPNKNGTVTGTVAYEPKLRSTFTEDGRHGKRMLSFASETSKTEEIMRIVPITPGVTQIMENEKESVVVECSQNVTNTCKQIDDNSKPIESIGKKEFQSRVLKFKSATHPILVKTSGAADNFYTELRDDLKSNNLDEINNIPLFQIKEEKSFSSDSSLQNNNGLNYKKTDRYKEDVYDKKAQFPDNIENTLCNIDDVPLKTYSKKDKYVHNGDINNQNGVERMPLDLKNDIHNSMTSPRRARTLRNGTENDIKKDISELSKKTDMNDVFEISPSVSPLPRSPSPVKVAGMKPLFWNKINVSPNSYNHDKVFWLTLKGQVPFDENEFEKLFSKPLQSPRAIRTRSQQQDGGLEGGVLKVLGSERSRQVAIRASSVHLAIEDIHDAIVNLDDELLDIDAIEALYDVRPTQNELDSIASALKRYPEALLDKPEQFLLMLAMISNLDDRLKSWLFVRKFNDVADDIGDQLATIKEACKQTVKNSTLQHAFEIILALGNFLNNGTQRGKADGFHFDILPKIKDLKSANGDINLLKYIVKMFINGDKLFEYKLFNYEESVNDCEEQDCPLPEQNLLHKAASISLAENLQSLDELNKEANLIEDVLLPRIIDGSTCLSDVAGFRKKMATYMQQIFNDLDELRISSRTTVEIVQEFQKYYVPDEENLEKETFNNILYYVEQFCEDFRSIWRMEKREEVKKALNAIKKTKSQRESSIRVSHSPTALKKRFMEKRQRENMDTQRPLPEYIPKNRNTKHVVIETNGHDAQQSTLEMIERNHADEKSTVTQYADQNESHKNDSQLNLYVCKARKNSLEIEERMKMMKPDNGLSRLKQSKIEKKLFLKAKTC